MINKKIALILCLDENKENKYEYECLYCVKHWRNLNHFLNDIDIIIYIEKNANISHNTILKLKKFKNIIFKTYEFKLPYLCLNTLYCQYLFEKYEVNYDIGIYIDLDLYIQNDIPKKYLLTDKTMFCIYNLNIISNNDLTYNYRIKNMAILNTYAFNTFFIINFVKHKIFQKLYSIMMSDDYLDFFKKYIIFNNDDFYFEEGIYDYAKFNNILNNTNCLFVNECDFILNNNIFLHQHIKTYKNLLNI